MSRTLLLALCCLSIHCSGAANKTQVAAEPTTPEPEAAVSAAEPTAEWDAFVGQFIEASLAANPGWAVGEGRHEFDGMVADMSPAGIAAEQQRLQQAKARAEAFDPAALDEAQRFERDYLLAVLDDKLFWSVTLKSHERSPLEYSWLISPSVYLTREYAPLPQRMAAYIKLAEQVPVVMAQMKANLKSPMPRTFVEVGIKVFGGLGPYLEKDVPGIFAGVKDEALQAQLAKVTPIAASAVKDAAAWLKEQLKVANDDFALGPELFSQMLKASERVDVPLEKLIAVGEADLERNLAALRAECEKITPGKGLPDCVAKVQAVKPAEGPVAGARAQLAGLREFLVDQKLVSIPGTEVAKVEEAPPYQRWNAAYIEIPGPFEKNLPSVYYIAPPDPGWSDEDRLAYIPGEADLLFISVHEVWPGHFLQFLHSNRSERPIGRMFSSYAFTEGWAHYTEEMMWEAGLSRGDSITHVGQLLNALLRNVRFLSAIGLHTQGMTVAESEAMFRDKALQDPGNARQQAARGTFDPGYLNYTLGKLMLRKMREDWTASRGGRQAWGQFHDRVLSYGSPPLPLVRKVMVGQGDLL